MLRTLRSVPKTARSAAPARRLRDLADRLEQAERRAFDELRERGIPKPRGASPIPADTVVHLRRLARHWDERQAAGLPVPLIGRVRKELLGERKNDFERQLLAIGKWLRGNAAAQAAWGKAKLSRELVMVFASAHTTCSCGVCAPERGCGLTCRLVAACRAAVELDEMIATAPTSPIRQLLTAVFEVVSALDAAVEQVLKANPEIELPLETLEDNSTAVARLFAAPELPLALSYGLEHSVVVLRVIADGLISYGEERCDFNHLSLAEVGVIGRGAPKLRRAPAQYLAHGGLELVPSAAGFKVKTLWRGPAKALSGCDERTIFV
jgi:hypothetical protein